MSRFARAKMVHDGCVTAVEDVESGLTAVLAVGDTTLGSAAGGLRVRPYAREEHAVAHALQEARAAALRYALADLPFGGGSLVISAPAGAERSDMVREAAERIALQAGERFRLIEDPVEERIVHAQARPTATMGADLAAEGLLTCLTVALRHKTGAADLGGATVAVQGLGPVGWEFCRLLSEVGANLVVTDERLHLRQAAERTFGAVPVAPGFIYEVACEAFAPCGPPAILSGGTIERLKTLVVAGVARDQLLEPSSAEHLQDRGILYVPDCLTGAAGSIAAAADILAPGDPHWVDEKLESLAETVEETLTQARAECCSPGRIALRLAEHRLSRFQTAVAA